MKHLPILIILLIISTVAISQTSYTIAFAYDGAGNRISRTATVVLKSAKMEGSDTTATFTAEDLEKTIKQKEKFESVDGDYKFTLFPNPTHGRLVLKIDPFNDELAGTEYAVYSVGGKRIKAGELTGYLLEIDLSEQTKGNYILELEINGEKKQWKILKQ